MGVNLKDIVPHERIDFSDLKGKIIAVDALNSLYQFLASIRQPDGTPLMDSKKRVTSHLSGLLYRTVRLVSLGIKPIYVFDGKPPDLKLREIEQRRELKREAESEWKKALAEERIDDAKKFAQRTSRITRDMIADSKRLLELMGIPAVQAPSEGEAQCVHICKKGDAWAVGSQDYDSLLLGAEKLVRGLTLSGSFDLEMIQVGNALKNLSVTREQLIDIAILVGTDFNEGVKGIGPKKALRIIKEGKLDTVELNFDIDKVRKIFLNPDVSDDYRIEFGKPDAEGLISFLCVEHDFSPERVRKASENMETALKELSQKDLSTWF